MGPYPISLFSLFIKNARGVIRNAKLSENSETRESSMYITENKPVSVDFHWFTEDRAREGGGCSGAIMQWRSLGRAESARKSFSQTKSDSLNTLGATKMAERQSEKWGVKGGAAG